MTALTRSDWQVGQLRLTVFPVIPLAVIANDWWGTVVGTPPEEVTTNLREATQVAAGPFNAGGLVLQVAPQRIDWIFLPKPLDDEGVEALAKQPKINTVGPYETSLPAFRDVSHKWLRGNVDFQVSRVAFGAVLSYPERDRESAYRRLEEYLQISIPSGASDFQYQINLPKEQDVGGATLTINRLMKWSALKQELRHFTATIGPGEASASSREISGPIYGTRLELDVNTAPNPRATLESTNLSAVFETLIDLGNRCVDAGIQSK